MLDKNCVESDVPMEQSKAERLIGLDVFRILSVLMIFFFHTGHIDCSYGLLQGFISMGAMFMTAFYMLSGFALSYTNQHRNLLDITELKQYGIKRFIGIMPLYWVIAIIYTVYTIICEDASLLKNIVLIPIEILGLQTVFCSLFGETHNGGTWFISCLIFCYAVFPLLQFLLRNMGWNVKRVLFLLIVAVLLYSPLIVWLFKLDSIYSNPFFRICEFTLGIILCDIWTKRRQDRIYSKWIAKRMTMLIVFILLVSGVTIIWNLNISRWNYMLYSWIGIPMFSIMILGLASLQFNRLKTSKILKYCVDASYVFFLAQFFTWPLVKGALVPLGGYKEVCVPIRVLISLLICCSLTVMMRELIENR